MNKFKKYSFLFTGFVLGIIFSVFLATTVRGASPVLNVCADSHGNLRLLLNGDCKHNETQYSLSNGLNDTLRPPFTCPNCQLQKYAQNFHGVNSGIGDKLAGKDLTNAYLSGANLNGNDLTGANLTGADFTDASLTFDGDNKTTNLTNANLTDANFTNADLTGAILAGANITGVIWSNTTCPDGINSDNVSNTCANDLTPTTTPPQH